MPTIPEILLGQTPAEREALLRLLPEHRVKAVNRAFAEWAHRGQLEPADDWRTWVLMAGRGFGKTRAGAEWVLGLVRGESARASLGSGSSPELARGEVAISGESVSSCEGRSRSPGRLGSPLADLRIALVAATADEARAVMVEGPSGILACTRPDEIEDWSPTRHELTFTGGARAVLFSGANPEALRGPQHHFAWCDELAKWRHPERTWDMLQLGLRCGERPRALVTTTPRGDPRSAVEQCVYAAERSANRYSYGGRAKVTDIRDIDARRDGYKVRGRIAVNSRNGDWRRGWGDDWRGWNGRYSGYDAGSFTCEVRYNRVVDLDFNGIRGLR